MLLQPIEATPIERTESASITDEAAAAALARATVSLFKAWKLSDAEATTLLGTASGWISSSAMARMRRTRCSR